MVVVANFLTMVTTETVGAGVVTGTPVMTGVAGIEIVDAMTVAGKEF